MTSSSLMLLWPVVAAAIFSAALTAAIRPLLLRHALARPNARSSHRIPTPQGAGIAVIAATILSVSLVAWFDASIMKLPFAVFAATLFLAGVGFADDLRSIDVLPRLLLQALAIAVVLSISATGARLFPTLPAAIEMTLLLLAGLWFVNLVNFMDGLDWMTVAEVVPITAALSVLGWLGELDATPALVAAALGGAMIGFAPFNRPVAVIFLGDVGSLPIGLLVGWCLLALAGHQHIAAAILLPLYYLADATVTLLRRLARGEKVWAAHRSHFYQRATDNGFTVGRVVGEVFVLNIVLSILAIASARLSSDFASAALLLAGAVATAILLVRFSRQRRVR